MHSQYIQGESRDKREGYIITLGDNSEALHALNILIPNSDKEWHPELKAWWINKGFKKHLDFLFSEFHLGICQQGELL